MSDVKLFDARDTQERPEGRRRESVLLAAMFAVGLGTAPLGAVAAEDTGRSAADTSPGAATSSAPRSETGGSDVQASSEAQQGMPAGLYKASKLIGEDVRDAQGNDIGDISDLALDTNQGRVLYAVVSVGGVMGVGGDKYAVALDSFDTSQVTDEGLRLNISEDQLTSMQKIDDNNWPTSASQSGAADGGIGDAGSQAASSSVVKASDYMNKDVKNLNDEDLGNISDLAINLESGEIAYAVLSHGGTLGMGGDMIAVPTDAFSTGAGQDDDAVVLSATEEQLESVRGFSDDNWPERAEFARFETEGGRDQSPSMQDDGSSMQNRGTQDPASGDPSAQDPMQPGGSNP